MQVSIRKTSDIFCVEISGKLSYERIESFSLVCRKQLLGKKIVLNCERLSFVGSVGITDFLHLLASMAKAGTELKYVGLAKEFIKLSDSMSATKHMHFALYPTNFAAIKSFQNPIKETREDVVVAEQNTVTDLVD